MRVSASPEVGILADRSTDEDTGAVIHLSGVDPLRQTHSPPSAAARYVSTSGFSVCSGDP